MKLIFGVKIKGFLNGEKDIMWNQNGVNIILGIPGSGKTEFLRFIHGVISAHLDKSNYYIPRVPITGNGEIQFYDGVLRWNHETGEVTAVGDIPRITICMYSPTEIIDLDEVYREVEGAIDCYKYLGYEPAYRRLLDAIVPEEGIGSSIGVRNKEWTCLIGNKEVPFSELPLNWALLMYMCLKLPTEYNTEIGHIYILDMPEYGLEKMRFSIRLLQAMEDFNSETQFFLATAKPHMLHCNSYNADKIYEI